jgi:hypothetical protein
MIKNEKKHTELIFWTQLNIDLIVATMGIHTIGARSLGVVLSAGIIVIRGWECGDRWRASRT